MSNPTLRILESKPAGIADAHTSLKALPNKAIYATATGETTLTAAQMLSGTLMCTTGGGAVEYTLCAANTLVAAIPDAAVNDLFPLDFVNIDAGAITLLANGTATLGFNATIAATSLVRTYIHITNVTSGTEAYVLYNN